MSELGQAEKHETLLVALTIDYSASTKQQF